MPPRLEFDTFTPISANGSVTRMRHSPLIFNYQFHVGLFAQMSASPNSVLGCDRLPHSGGHSANDMVSKNSARVCKV